MPYDMNAQLIINDEWCHVLNMLPGDMEESCDAKLAIRRRRQITSPQNLLRLCLGYSLCDMSLRQLAAWSAVSGLGELSDVAILKRLRASSDWLGHLVFQWLEQHGVDSVTGAGQWRVRLIDATTIQRPGSRTTDLRLHAGFDLASQRLTTLELTGCEGGESLKRHLFEEGEVVIGDRGYAHAAGIASALRQGAHALVRGHWQNLPLQNKAGRKLDVIELMGLIDGDELGDWPVWIENDGERFAMRLILMRQSAEATERQQRTIRAEARKKGREPNPKSLRAAGWMMVLTDLEASQLPAVQALELYRFRWQIELAFKRLKSLHHLDRIRAKDERLAQTYVFGKLLGALIVEELGERALDFFPWGFPLVAQGAQPLEAGRSVAGLAERGG